MATMKFFFRDVEGKHCVPVIRDEDTVEYTCDGKEGSLGFDEYFI